MVNWIKLEKDDLNGLQYRKASIEEKAILLDLLALSMTDEIELNYCQADQIIDYAEMADVLGVSSTQLANTIRRFSKLIEVEIEGHIAKLKLKPTEIAKQSLEDKTVKAKKAANSRWDKDFQDRQNEKLRKSKDASALQMQSKSNASEIQAQSDCNADEMPLDKKRIEKNRKERGEEQKEFCESENFASPESPPSFSFYDEITFWYKQKGISLQSINKAKSLLNEVLKEFKNTDRLKELLNKAISEKPDKYLQPFGFINFLEWLIANKTKLNKQSEPVVSSTYKPTLLTEAERIKALEAKDKVKQDLISKGIIPQQTQSVAEVQPITEQEKRERIEKARKIISGKELVSP